MRTATPYVCDIDDNWPAKDAKQTKYQNIVKAENQVLSADIKGHMLNIIQINQGIVFMCSAKYDMYAYIRC